MVKYNSGYILYTTCQSRSHTDGLCVTN